MTAIFVWFGLVSSTRQSPVRSLSGVGEAQHSAELQPQEQVEEDQGFLGQSAGDVVLLSNPRAQGRTQSVSKEQIFNRYYYDLSIHHHVLSCAAFTAVF